MKTLFTILRWVLQGIGRLVVSPSEVIRYAFMSSEARQREAREAERLDRIRNPRDYEGK